MTTFEHVDAVEQIKSAELGLAKIRNAMRYLRRAESRFAAQLVDAIHHDKAKLFAAMDNFPQVRKLVAQRMPHMMAEWYGERRANEERTDSLIDQAVRELS